MDEQIEKYASCMFNTFDKFRKTKRFCDFEVSVSGHSFAVHKVILAARSKYFDRMFSVGMKESQENHVPILEVDLASFEIALKYIYKDMNWNLSLENVYGILFAATLMQLDGLVEEVCSFMLSINDENNCVYLRSVSNMFSLFDVKKKVEKFLLDHFESIIRRNTINEVTGEYMTEIFQSDNLKVKSEHVVYETLVKWTTKEPLMRMPYFPHLFSHIRLQLLSIKYLCNVVCKQALVMKFPECLLQVRKAMESHLRCTKYLPQKPRRYHVFGGSTVAICSQSNIYIYNYVQSSWNVMKAGKVLLEGCTIASHYQSLSFCGGFKKKSKTSSSTVTTFDGNRWTKLPPMNSGRAHAPVAYVYDILYIFGGVKKPMEGPKGHLVNDFEYFDDSRKMWIIAGMLQTLRCLAAAVAYNETVYILGGMTMVDFNSTFLTVCPIVESYNTVDKTWSYLQPMFEMRSSFGAAVWGGKIFAVGGVNNHGNSVIKNEFMNISSGNWTMIHQEMPFHTGNTRVCVAGAKLIIVGMTTNKIMLLDLREHTYKIIEQTLLPGVRHKEVAPIVWRRHCFL